MRDPLGSMPARARQPDISPPVCASFALKRLEHSDLTLSAAMFDGWQLEYSQMARGTYRTSSQAACLSDLQIYSETSNIKTSQHGSAPSGCIAIGIPLAMSEMGLFNGRPWAGGIVAFRGGEAIEAVVPAMQLLVITVDEQELVRHLWWTQRIRIDRWLDRTALTETDPARCRSLAARLRVIADASFANGDLLERSECRSGLLNSVLEELVPLVLPNLEVAPPALGQFSRMQLVRRSRDYIYDHVDQPLQVVDLCRALGVSRRALQYSFEQVLGVNPLTYLRNLRLNGARKELMAKAHSGIAVRDVLARWGFWHASRFSIEYRKLFGELPSETLHRARRQA